jgi:hypothetical protein
MVGEETTRRGGWGKEEESPLSEDFRKPAPQIQMWGACPLNSLNLTDASLVVCLLCSHKKLLAESRSAFGLEFTGSVSF